MAGVQAGQVLYAAPDYFPQLYDFAVDLIEGNGASMMRQAG
ncbi:MAG: hypothetical protein R2787_01505 [Saprospiraceae bacterium]